MESEDRAVIYSNRASDKPKYAGNSYEKNVFLLNVTERQFPAILDICI